jgi:Trk K+ transport system NAD-binding subunit
VVGLITLVGLVTIGLSTYLILYSHQIFNFLSPFLSVFERKNKLVEQESTDLDSSDYNVIIIGIGRFGNRLADMLDKQTKISYLGIDFDPSIIKDWRENNRPIIYGDIDDPDLLEIVPYKNADIIISTVHDLGLSKQLVNDLKRRQYKGEVFVTALTDKENIDLKRMGIENVLLPHSMAASNFFNTYLKNKKFE